MSTIPAWRNDVEMAFASLAVSLPNNPTMSDIIGANRELMGRYGLPDETTSLVGVKVVPVTGEAFSGEWLEPDDGTFGQVIVYLHGGGWIGGGLPVYRSVGATLARIAKCSVLVVDYRLAPEHPFPAALDDCLAAFTLAQARASNANRVCLAGDSAGGNLAAAITISLLQQERTPPDRLALLCGVLDVAPSDYVARHDPLCTSAGLLGAFGLYGQDRVDSRDPLVSPIEAENRILERFPPTLLQVSSDEFLADASYRFVGKLQRAGRRAIFSTWPLMPHSWQCFLEMLPEAKAALAEVSEFFAQ